MALSGSAARRYAEALYDLAADEGGVDAFRASFDALAAGLGPAALRSLRDPSVPMKQRVAAVEAAAKGHPRAIGSLLVLLTQRDRIGILPDIARAFADLVDRRAGIVKAKITTAVALDDAKRQAFVSRLESASGKKIKATFGVDPDLIGGARVQLGDHLVDSSVRAHLNSLRQSLAGN